MASRDERGDRIAGTTLGGERKSSATGEIGRTVAYAVIIALFVRTFLFEPFNIPSGSMKPTLLVGDYLFVSKYAYGYSRYSMPWGVPLINGRVLTTYPERGDVVVFKTPADNTTDYIKRIIGLPGDRIQMRENVLYINDKPVPVRPAGTFTDEYAGVAGEGAQFIETLPNGVEHLIIDSSPIGPLDNTGVFEVPEGHVFAMGDNRDNSQDSRTTQVGYIPVENLIGRATFIWMSSNGDARLWEIWKWPFGIRWSRLGQVIH